MKTVTFTSWSEMLDYARRTPPMPADGHQASRSVGSDREEWTGTYSFDGAMRLAELGWPEATAKATALTAALVDKVSSLMEHDRITYDVTGRDFDVSMMLTGEPEHWSDTETVVTDGPSTRILKMVINGFVSCGVDNDVIIARGAAIAALIATLELSGFRVEVIHRTPFHCSSAKLDFVTPIKSADQPLDLDRLIFAVGHPSMFRRLMFSSLEHNPAERKHLDSYGKSNCTIDQDDQGDLYIAQTGYGDPQWTNTETAAKWVLAQAKAQGVVLTHN